VSVDFSSADSLVGCLISMRTYVSAHTKAIVVGRQIYRKIVGIPFKQESWPTIDRAWCTMRVRTFTDYPGR
jgi:hypothetical protein